MTQKAIDPFQQEVDRNYEAFLKLDDDFYCQHFGSYALMKDTKVVEVFSTWQDARKAAKLLYGEEPFSIQEVGKEAIDLGFYSHAVSCC